VSAAGETGVQRRALVLAAVVMVALALFVGGGQDSGTHQPPSTLLAGDGGARALFELAAELGLDSRRWMLPTDGPPFDERVHALAILGTGDSVTGVEARALLAWVSAGGRLFYAPDAEVQHALDRDPLLAALAVSGVTKSAESGGRIRQHPPDDLSPRARLLLEGTPAELPYSGAAIDLRDAGQRGDEPPDEELIGFGGRRAALALLHRGAGTVVLLADVRELGNEALAKSALTAATLRALVLLADGGPLWFDEFHHGHDERTGVLGAGRRFLLTAHAGWALLALIGLTLLAAACAGVRLGPPLPEPPPPGRSSLEHVDALAAAWSAARAHARPAALLVEGLRLRLGVAHQKDLRGRLHAAVARTPRLRTAVDTIVSAKDGALVPLAAAIDEVLEAEGRSALPSGWDARS